jgi:hypothetical protein
MSTSDFYFFYFGPFFARNPRKRPFYETHFDAMFVLFPGRPGRVTCTDWRPWWFTEAAPRTATLSPTGVAPFAPSPDTGAQPLLTLVLSPGNFFPLEFLKNLMVTIQKPRQWKRKLLCSRNGWLSSILSFLLSSL